MGFSLGHKKFSAVIWKKQASKQFSFLRIYLYLSLIEKCNMMEAKCRMWLKGLNPSVHINDGR